MHPDRSSPRRRPRPIKRIQQIEIAHLIQPDPIRRQIKIIQQRLRLAISYRRSTNPDHPLPTPILSSVRTATTLNSLLTDRRRVKNLIQHPTNDAPDAKTQIRIRRRRLDPVEKADKQAELLDGFGAREAQGRVGGGGRGALKVVFGLLFEELDAECARGRDAEVHDQPLEVVLVALEVVAVGPEDEDEAEHLFGDVENGLASCEVVFDHEAFEEEVALEMLQTAAELGPYYVA